MHEQTRTTAVPTSTVTRSMDLAFLEAEGVGASLRSEFTYRASDPYAVSIVFRSAEQEVCWTFGRELLVAGIHEPTGMGDVQMFPCLSDEGAAVVVIELSSPDGTVLVQAPSREVGLFVHEMLALVPLGHESDLVDVDAALAELLGEQMI